MGNLSVRCTNEKPGAALIASSRRSSASMSSSRLFLGGLLSSRARFRFTGRHQNAIKWSCRSRFLQRTANRVLTVCLSKGSNPSCKLPVFIKSVHIVDDAKGVIFEIAPSLVWLHVPNEAENLSSHNPLYFSLVSADFLFRDWLFPKDREFNCVATYKPQIMPDS